MNKYIVYAIYITVIIEGIEKKYTFITKNPDFIKNEINKIYSTSLFNIETNIDNEDQRFLAKRKHKTEIKAFDHALANKEFMRLNGHIPFEGGINYPSIFTKVLLDAKLYKPETDLEKILAEYCILESYYNGDVTFEIRHITEEFSQSFGQKQFINHSNQQRVDIRHFHDGFITNHIGEVYTSKTISKIYRILGKNDFGENIDIHLTKINKKT